MGAPPTPGQRPVLTWARGTGPKHTMKFPILTAKTESLYFACSPERDVVSYGGCQDEALNNLQDELQIREQTAGEENHAH